MYSYWKSWCSIAILVCWKVLSIKHVPTEWLFRNHSCCKTIAVFPYRLPFLFLANFLQLPQRFHHQLLYPFPPTGSPNTWQGVDPQHQPFLYPTFTQPSPRHWSAMSLAEAMACKHAASFRASCSSRHNFRASEANLGMVGGQFLLDFLGFLKGMMVGVQ